MLANISGEAKHLKYRGKVSQSLGSFLLQGVTVVLILGPEAVKLHPTIHGETTAVLIFQVGKT